MNFNLVASVSQFFEAVDPKARTARLRKVKLRADQLFKKAGDNWQSSVADQGRKAFNIVAKFKRKRREANMSTGAKIWSGMWANQAKAKKCESTATPDMHASFAKTQKSIVSKNKAWYRKHLKNVKGGFAGNKNTFAVTKPPMHGEDDGVSEAVDPTVRDKRIYALGKLLKSTKVVKSDYSHSNNLKSGVVRRLKAIIAKHKDPNIRRKTDMNKLWLNHDAFHARSSHRFFKKQQASYGKS